MSTDLLDRATRALRETTGSDPAAEARVLERLDRRRPAARLSMRPVRIIAWTLAGSLLGVGAWANATGRVNWFVPEPPGAPSEPAASAPVAATSPRERLRRHAGSPADELAPEVTPEPVPEVPPEPPVSAPPRAPALAETPPRARAPSVVAPAAPARAPAPVPDADGAYRAAHEAHFVRADYAEALALWDRYLAVAEPGHRWKIEARYNRGIALYRLGQSAPAREALEPFARGEYGAYRRDDARRLLDALPTEALP